MEAVAPKKPKKMASKETKAVKTAFSKETYLKWYETMYRIRKFEEQAYKNYGTHVKGFCHVYIGQEAIAAGIQSALRPQDALVTAYRQHGIALMKGLTSRACMAELFGKADGCMKGKGGSMHFFSAEHRYFGGNGIVGAQIGIGTGIAFAEKYRGSDLLCVTMFGDGASRQGLLYEAGNMAMTWKLPVIYVCENNGYAMGTSVARTSNVTEISKVAEAFDMPAEIVDGMSPEAVHEAFARAAEHIRAGKGPYFLEVKTYRFEGHSVSDPQGYRKNEEGKKEMNHYKNIDPIKVTREKMVSQKIASLEEVETIEANIKEEIREAVEFALNSPFPHESELFTDNYLESDYPYMTD
jgi:pyruvate dehydrogenase E1 component alpha subunit